MSQHHNKKYNFYKIMTIFSLLMFCKFIWAEESFSIIPPIQTTNQNTGAASVPLVLQQQINTEIKTDTNAADKVTEEAPKNTLNAQEFSAKQEKNIKANNKLNELKEAAAFNTTKKFLSESHEDRSLWKGASLVVGFISTIGLLAYLLTRFVRRGSFRNSKKDAAMSVVSKIDITPKRQIMLLQIRDKEIVISNTESGIQFMMDIAANISKQERIIEKKPLQIENIIKQSSSYERKIESDYTNSLSKPATDKKSDLLLKAIKKIERESPKENFTPAEEKIEDNNANAKFPKYFSNIFENESKKDIRKKEDNESVENVTNLIREKLRSMKPLN